MWGRWIDVMFSEIVHILLISTPAAAPVLKEVDVCRHLCPFQQHLMTSGLDAKLGWIWLVFGWETVTASLIYSKKRPSVNV